VTASAGNFRAIVTPCRSSAFDQRSFWTVSRAPIMA
jgi:hypothetical protein